MSRQPGSTCWKHTPCGAVDGTSYTPQVCIMMGYPSTTTIHYLSCLCTRMTQVTNHREQGLLRLCKITHQGRPVIHFGIDIDSVL